MEILIEDLNGVETVVSFEDVSAVYRDDDVVYFSGVAYYLSTARPNPASRLTALEGHANGKIADFTPILDDLAAAIATAHTIHARLGTEIAATYDEEAARRNFLQRQRSRLEDDLDSIRLALRLVTDAVEATNADASVQYTDPRAR